jgi:multidrug efflux pump subunit AcrB
MTFIRLVETQARAIVVLAVALAIAGGAAALSLPVGLFPQVSFPRVVVDVDAGSRPANQTALLVTTPLEEAIRTVPGVQNVRSDTSRGASQIAIDFAWGTDMVASTLLVDAAIAKTLPSLPVGTVYNVRRMDPTVYPIIAYALQSDTVSGTALYDLAQYQIRPMLSSIPGLARVMVQGGNTAEVQVLADPHRLATYSIGLNELSAVLTSGNVLQAVGQIQDRDKLFLVLTGNSATKPSDIGALVVRSNPNGVVRVRDVATVQAGVMPQWTRVIEDGQPAVLFSVYEQPDGNAVQIAQAVQQKLAAFALPAGVRLANWYDQSQLVVQSTASVRDAILIGLVLAGLVLMLFLRSWRVTSIAILVVPATLMTTIVVLSAAGMSFNIMTLGGIAAAVGLLIDDVIVMVEHIARRAGARDARGNVAGDSAVLSASREFLQPLTGSSLATLIVFLPLSFLTGVTGAFSKALAITMAAALAISYLMTAFVVPVLSRWFVDFNTWHDPSRAGRDWLGRTHRRVLILLIRQPFILPIALAPLLAIGFYAYQKVPTGFMPAVDEGGFIIDYFTKPGTSLTETEREIGQVDELLKKNPDVMTFSRRLGSGLGGNLGQSYHGDYFVRLKDSHKQTTPQVMAAVGAEIGNLVPGVQVELAQLMEDLIGDLTAVPQPIEIKLYGAAEPALIVQANSIAAAIAKVPGVVAVKNGVNLAGDALDVGVDPVRASMEGVTPDQIVQTVNTALTGVVATYLPQDIKFEGVRVRLPDALSLQTSDLSQLPLRASDGHLFPLSRIATITPVTGQPQISRENLQPMIAVTGRIQGRGLGAAVGDVQNLLNAPGTLAPGISYVLGGLFQQQQIAFAGLARVFIAALMAEFILLLVLYRQFWLPIIIIGCSLLSTAAVFTALWLTNVELNVTALMGMTMIIGISTEMSIFFASEYRELLGHMLPRRALREASRNRLRPITMTTLAAILTLAPLAFAIGQGSAIQQPLAIAIIAGLFLQFPLVLLAMPVLVGLTLPRRPR